MKTTPIFFLETNARMLELGHFSRFQNPPFGCTFASKFIVPVRDLEHVLVEPTPKNIYWEDEMITYETTPADDRHSR